MIYIIGNVVLAIMLIVGYVKFHRLKITSANGIEDLQKKLDREVSERIAAEEKFLTLSTTHNKKQESATQELLHEISELRKDKEEELKLRLEAEKQIELALQKVEETKRRLQDWHIIQDSVMKDAKDAVAKMGEDLFKRLNENYGASRALISDSVASKTSKIISEFLTKIATEKKLAEENRISSVTMPHSKATQLNVNDPAKKLLADIIALMEANGHIVNTDYFLPKNLDSQKAKLLLCEIAFVSFETLYILDFKACRYFEEYKTARDSNRLAAEAVLKQRLDKYFAYLGNPKYRDSILKAVSSAKAKFNKPKIVIILPSKIEIQIAKEIRYYEKANQEGFSIMDFDGASNLVL